jgi:hypothetical protein
LNPNMKLFPSIGSLRSSASAQFTAHMAGLSRGLLFIIAVEIITMPVTQDLWTWDKFLHGGQDFELSMLITVTCLCLTLLGAEQGRGDLDLLVALRILLLGAPPDCVTLVHSHGSTEHQLGTESNSPTRLFPLPLLI